MEGDPKDLPTYFRIAAEASLKSNYKFQLGAVIMTGGKIIGRGHNSAKKHPLTRTKDPNQSIHAEVSAILKCRHKHDLKGATVVVYRTKKSGLLGLSRPCSSCQAILRSFGIKKMIYTTEKGFFEEKL